MDYRHTACSAVLFFLSLGFWCNKLIRFLENKQHVCWAGAADICQWIYNLCQKSVVYWCNHATTWADRATEEVTGWGRLAPPPPTRLHVHPETHWLILGPHTENSTASHHITVCVFGVYWYEASEDNWDSEAVMCKGLHQMRSSGMVSLEFIPSSSTIRTAALCLYKETQTEVGLTIHVYSIYSSDLSQIRI